MTFHGLQRHTTHQSPKIQGQLEDANVRKFSTENWKEKGSSEVATSSGWNPPSQKSTGLSQVQTELTCPVLEETDIIIPFSD